MTTENVEGKEQPQTPTPEVEAKPQPEQVTLGKEELSNLMAEAVNKGIAQREETYKAQQRELTKQDLERKRKMQEPPVEDSGYKTLAEATAKAIENQDPSLMRQVAAEIEQKKMVETQQRQWNEYVSKEEERVLGLIYDQDLDPGDDKLEPVMDWIEVGKKTGDFSIAEKKLNKIAKQIKAQPKEEAKVEPKEEPKKEEPKVEPKEEDILKYLKEKKGIDLTSDMGSPSGGEIIPDTARGKIKAGWDEIHK